MGSYIHTELVVICVFGGVIRRRVAGHEHATSSPLRLGRDRDTGKMNSMS